MESSSTPRTQKFRVKIDEKMEVVYYIDAIPRIVLKVDGAHRYYWYRDHRINIATMVPIFPIEGAKREIHET